MKGFEDWSLRSRSRSFEAFEGFEGGFKAFLTFEAFGFLPPFPSQGFEGFEGLVEEESRNGFNAQAQVFAKLGLEVFTLCACMFCILRFQSVLDPIFLILKFATKR